MTAKIQLCSLVGKQNKQAVKDKSDGTEGSDSTYLYITDEKELDQALNEINVAITENPIIAVDCEGTNFSREGQLSLVSVATRDKVFLFDVLTLDGLIFDKGLRSILENKNIYKLMFDCREDADILQHVYHVTIDGIVDIQLLEIIKRHQKKEKTLKHKERSERHIDVVKLASLLICLQKYTKHDNIVSIKKKAKTKMAEDHNIWKERPLKHDLLSYASIDVSSLFLLLDHFNPDEEQIKRLLVASDLYANLHRRKPTRNYGHYERNKYLPVDIIPQKGSINVKTGYIECTTCNRCFTADEFYTICLKLGIQKCRTCRHICYDIYGKGTNENRIFTNSFYH